MHKYDWSNVDSRLSFLATDCDGLVYGFTHKPKLTDWGFAPTNGFSKQVYGACCGFGFNKEWRDSLEERPKEPAMSEFKVGDKVVVKDTPFWPDDHFIQTVKAEHIGQWYMNSWRLAEPAEVQAGFRKGCKAFDDYWYGRS
ncbi:hypothetical protein [Acinetobacter pittii]|uniref:hypothetical protein n=1 Tax=Acinetobacter pittii TaxID=48296 RepID=UPI00301E1717